MKRHCLITALLISADAFTPSPPILRSKQLIISETALHNYSISGNDKRNNRPSIAPLSPDTGAVNNAGPISHNYRRALHRTVNPPKRIRDDSSQSRDIQQQQRPPPPNQSHQQEITRLKQSLKERDDDVETLIYEVYRLQELSAQIKNVNEARSNDFTILKREAERLKQDFEQRTRQNEEKMATLLERLRDREERIGRLERLLTQNAKTISDLESRIMIDGGVNGGVVSSPSIGMTTTNRIPQRQYRATRSYNENKNVAVVGGAPILYRSPSMKQGSLREYMSGGLNSMVESGEYDPSLHNNMLVNEEYDWSDPSIVYDTTSTMEQLESDATVYEYDTSMNENVEFDSNIETNNDENHYPRPNGIGYGNKGIYEVQ